jgi:hypothetical protein
MTMRMSTALVLGMAAGVVGTAAMTLSQTLEMKITSREASAVPGQVGARLLGRSAEAAPQQLNTPVHWAHGIAMGGVRGLLAQTALTPSAATALHFAAVWGGDVVLYRTLGIAQAPWQWETDDLVTDVLHKGLYCMITGAALEAVRRKIVIGS